MSENETTIILETDESRYIGKYINSTRTVFINLRNAWEASGSERTFINMYAETLAHEFFHDAIRCEGDELTGALADRAVDIGFRSKCDDEKLGNLMVDMEEEVVKKCGLAKSHMTKDKDLELFLKMEFERMERGESEPCGYDHFYAKEGSEK